MIDKKQDADFVAYVCSLTTLAYGAYILYADSYLTERFGLWGLSATGENLIGIAIMIVSIVKLYGLFTDNKLMKRLGIIAMIVVWALIVGLYIFEALNLQFLGLTLTAPILVLCLRIARRGDFVE